MRKALVTLALLGTLAAPEAARAQSRTTLGVGSGAVAGALVGGPIGAVAGAVVGGFVGNSTERGRRHVRRGRRYAAPRRSYPRRAEAVVPRTTGSVARAAPPAQPTTWKDPR
ncbi:uncharacterized protein YcfJ [Methylobacterium sp. PvP062]|uniref:Uncharacterized protein YcfJ n=1 Tax=Methylobacterium radiotolerans TaxID=31998 RepID=A0ABV2NB74_9HYPH|nr:MULTISPECIES: hypothetical protein [unclassified Methylobacterium]MBP2493012.1 uncharacterized protein YcfJ [Methylobacterium sp. PvP105]MBP2500615.1 uncharacterized protein YcfJ [Methylobacterium sp. PvP109]MCX7330559.1 hypothetical protein [Hyphomicrobiales bacterium]